MKIETVDIEKIIPYARNPRKNEEAVAGVAASIREFGWQQPLVVDAENTIIVGHTRYLAAKQLGLEKVPIHKATSLSPEQVKAYRLLDNKLHEKSGWDDSLLAIELEDLSEFDFTAFDVPEFFGGGSSSSTPHGVVLSETFEVLIQCNSEEHQREVFDDLQKRGLKCRVLTL